MSENRNTQPAGQILGIIALILGVITLMMSWIPCFGFLFLIFGIAGIILSAIGLSQATRENGAKGLNIAALVVSSLATMLIISWLTVFSTAFYQFEDFFQKFKEATEQMDDMDQDWDDVFDDEEMQELNDSTQCDSSEAHV